MKTMELAAQTDSQRQCPALSNRDTAPWGLEETGSNAGTMPPQRASQRAQMRDCTPESASPTESMPRLRRVDHDAQTMPSLRATNPPNPVSGRYAYIAPPSRRVR